MKKIKLKYTSQVRRVIHDTPNPGDRLEVFPGFEGEYDYKTASRLLSIRSPETRRPLFEDVTPMTPSSPNVPAGIEERTSVTRRRRRRKTVKTKVSTEE